MQMRSMAFPCSLWPSLYIERSESLRKMKEGKVPPFVSMLRQIRKRLIEGRSSILEVVTMSTLIEECKGELIYYSLDDKFDSKTLIES